MSLGQRLFVHNLALSAHLTSPDRRVRKIVQVRASCSAVPPCAAPVLANGTALPVVCSGHGACGNGTCVCQTGRCRSLLPFFLLAKLACKSSCRGASEGKASVSCTQRTG